MNKTKKTLVSVLAFLVVCFMGMAGTNEVADVSIGSYGVSFLPKVNYGQIQLTVSRPDGTVFSKTFEPGSMPYFDLSENSGTVLNGSYTYELRVIPSINKTRVARKSFLNAGVKNSDPYDDKPLTQSGTFFAKGGAIVTGSVSEAGSGLPRTQGGPAQPLDQLILDDLIVDGSACIGMDCINGESFGFDTIRLKENNLRIRFYDTSTSASFPSNDWQITANDSSNGGANKFSIDDIDSGRTPFTIEAGTRANALYVDDSGRIGFGTSTPVEDLHIWCGDTPTIRLEQSGGGWAPQTWDIAGNEANFFIRDVTNGSNLPFRIQPDTPGDTLCLKSDGKVGIGTWSPAYPMELQRTGTAATFVCEQTDGATAVVSAGGSYVFIGAKSNNEFRLLVNDSPKMILTTDGKVGIGVTTVASANKLEVDNGARLTTGGVWTDASSIALKENITNLTTTEAMEALGGLNPVKFNYKAEKEEEYVGFIAEEVPELVATKDRKGMSPMDVVAVLTRVVQEQQKTIADLNNRIAELEKNSKSADNK